MKEETDPSQQDHYQARQWSIQLQKEHESLCYQYRLKLAPIAIEVTENKSYLGRWMPEERKIELSRSLILKQPWDTVLHILKHEVAHQICSEIYNIDDGHGEYFQRACQRLGVLPPFNQASIDITPDLINQWNRDSENTSPHWRKIEKLLSLAQSKNKNESYQAMAKAQQLIIKYNIDCGLKPNESKSDHVYCIINHKKKRIEFHQSQIVSLLTKYYFVRALYADLYDAETDQVHKVIELFGKKQNVAISEHIYWFLLQQANDLWRKNKTSSMNKRSYYIGFFSGIRSTLEKTTKNSMKSSINGLSATETKTLIAHESEQVADFLRTRYPRIHSRANNYRGSYNHDDFSKGQGDGQNVRISKGIKNSTGNQRPQLQWPTT